jgi:hypothetical protein
MYFNPVFYYLVLMRDNLLYKNLGRATVYNISVVHFL